jgi:glucose-6-phosphate isomerase
MSRRQQTHSVHPARRWRSAVGLSIALIIGVEHRETLLQGGHDIDEHFRQAPFDRNIPVKRRRAASRGTR